MQIANTKHKMENLHFKIRMVFLVWLVATLFGWWGVLHLHTQKQEYDTLQTSIHIHICTSLNQLGAKPVGIFDCSWVDAYRLHPVVEEVQHQLYFIPLLAAMVAGFAGLILFTRKEK